MLNRTLHKERTIAQWLSFDDPESRLKKAMKRDGFLNTSVKLSADEQAEETNSIEGKTAESLAALAFALEDAERFNPICFKRVKGIFESIEDLSCHRTLASIHPDLENVLKDSKKYSKEQIEWITLCIIFLAPRLWQIRMERGSKESGEYDSPAFLLQVRKQIEEKLAAEPATECSALITLAKSAYKNCLSSFGAMLTAEFLPEKLLLVEGQTEAILVPLFAQLLDFDFNKQRVHMISGGGANQVAKRFLTLRETTRLPIACLLDGDAESQYDTISEHLQHNDILTSLVTGEFEDTFEISIFTSLLNRYLQSMTGEYAPSLVEFEPLENSEFPSKVKRTHTLKKIWRERALGNFDKVEFAEFVAETLNSKQEIPEDFKLMIQTMREKWGERS